MTIACSHGKASQSFGVNDSGQVTALDALLVINGLNTRMELTPQLPDPFIPVAYVDVNGDGFLTPIDGAARHQRAQQSAFE